MSNVFDKILSSRPVNKHAGRILGGGVSYEPHFKVCRAQFDAPPKMRSVPSDCQNLTGVKFGRFSVVGMLAETSSNGAMWVVKCACGKYETRRSKAIKNNNNSGDRCSHCRHLLYLQHQDRRRQFGDKRAGVMQAEDRNKS